MGRVFGAKVTAWQRRNAKKRLKDSGFDRDQLKRQTDSLEKIAALPDHTYKTVADVADGIVKAIHDLT